MRIKYLLTASFVSLCLLLPSIAFTADEPVKIGDITAFSGEVLARTKGVWVKVKSAPHPVFSEDKVVTRRGRAEIGFIDGGVMRLNLDSNISIEQIEEEEGFAFKNKLSTRQVNLMVGEVWFSVKMAKGKKLNVRTPTMTAAVRGSSALLKQGVDLNAPSTYSYIEGDIETKGSFKAAPPKAISFGDVRSKAADLPSSNPEVDNSPVQKAAVDATETRSKALQAASRAGEDSEVAKAAGDQATKSQATDDKLLAATLKAQANTKKGEAAVLDKKAAMLAAQEKIIEAQAFKETQKLNEAQSTIGQLSKEITRLEVVKEELEAIAKKVDDAAQKGDLGTAEDALGKSEELLNDVPEPTAPPEDVVVETTASEEQASTEETESTEETQGTEELGYTEEGATTTTTTTETVPDTQDLGTSSPSQ